MSMAVTMRCGSAVDPGNGLIHGEKQRPVVCFGRGAFHRLPDSFGDAGDGECLVLSEDKRLRFG